MTAQIPKKKEQEIGSIKGGGEKRTLRWQTRRWTVEIWQAASRGIRFGRNNRKI